MIKDILGSVVSIIIAFILIGITPLYYTGIINWASAESRAIAYTRNLVDTVIDTRELTDSTLKEYNLNMASLSEYYVHTITREVKVTNPKPGTVDKTYSTYIAVDNNRVYDQGDIIIVEVQPVGDNVYRIIAQSLLGLRVPNDGFRLPGRVR